MRQLETDTTSFHYVIMQLQHYPCNAGQLEIDQTSNHCVIKLM